MNEKINIQDIVESLAVKQGMDKKGAEAFVKEFFALIEEGLEKDKYVKVKGLGTFKLIEVDSRESVNVNTGERIEIKGHSKISFTPESALKEIINRPFSHFESVVLKDSVVFEDIQNEEDETDRLADNDVDADTSSLTTVDELPEIEATVEEETPEVLTENIVQETGVEPVVSTETPTETEPLQSDSLEQESSSQESLEKSVSTMDIQSPVIEKEEEKKEEPQPKEKEVLQPEIVADSPKSSKGMNFFIGLLIVLALLCVGTVALMYWGEDDPQKPVANPIPTDEILDEQAEGDSMAIQQSDSMSFVKKDAVQSTDSSAIRETESEPVVRQDTARLVPKPVKKLIVAKPFTPDSTGYDIIGTETSYTMKEGETLTRVALKFYGTKALWPYIVKHNSKVIANPNNVPYGTTINIPKLKKKQ